MVDSDKAMNLLNSYNNFVNSVTRIKKNVLRSKGRDFSTKQSNDKKILFIVGRRKMITISESIGRTKIRWIRRFLKRRPREDRIVFCTERLKAKVNA